MCSIANRLNVCIQNIIMRDLVINNIFEVCRNVKVNFE